MKLLETREDVDESVLAAAEEILDGWFSNGERLNWEDFIDRLASHGQYASPAWDIESYDNPAVRRIKRYVQQLREEGR